LTGNTKTSFAPQLLGNMANVCNLMTAKHNLICRTDWRQSIVTQQRIASRTLSDKWVSRRASQATSKECWEPTANWSNPGNDH